jgi:glycerophosphoryl diester phosphodiesterase
MKIAFLRLACCFLLGLSNHQAHAQMITGHRGASHDAPENTLAAFELAWEQGADAIEGDFYLTADSHIVCIHDADTLRTTGVKKVVAQTTLEDLRALNAGLWKGDAFKGEKLPTFAEVLATVPRGKRFVIELKTDPSIVPFLAAEIERLKPDQASLLVIAFNADTIAACKAALPGVQAHWLTSFKQPNGNGRHGGGVSGNADNGTGEKRFDNGDDAWMPTADQIAETVRRIAADGVGMKGERAVVDQKFIDEMTAKGVKEFHVWTIDTPDDAIFFRDLGAVGITTNRPAFIRGALENGR